MKSFFTLLLLLLSLSLSSSSSPSSLHDAVLNNQISQVKEILAQSPAHVDLNLQNITTGSTAFLVACQKGHVDIVKLLLADPRIDVTKENFEYDSPLSAASENGHVAVVQTLLGDLRITSYAPAISVAARGGHAEIVRLLLLADKRPQISGNTFFQACAAGHHHVVKVLLDDGRADVNALGGRVATPFFAACENGHVEVVRLLLQETRKQVAYNQVSKDDYTPFFVASKDNHVEILKLLLADDRIDVNKGTLGDVTPFYIACNQGSAGSVEVLLTSSRVNVNTQRQDGTTPFLVACREGHTDVIRLLMNSKRIDKSKTLPDGRSAFYLASQSNKVEPVELLLENPNTDVNQLRGDGSTPLAAACAWGNVDIVEAILGSGRFVDIKKGNPIKVALRQGFDEVADVIERYDAKGLVLHKACLEGDLDGLKAILLNPEVDVSATSSQLKRTAAWICASRSRTEMLRWMIALGNTFPAKVKGVDQDGKEITPLEVASKLYFDDVVDLLKAYEKSPKETREEARRQLEVSEERTEL